MKINELFEDYGADSFHKIQAIFSSIFILQNRIQTAGEKIQTEISMKQWLLLAMTNYCKEPKTLTNVATLMGCSRQNVKKLSVALEKKGFVPIRIDGGYGLNTINFINAIVHQDGDDLIYITNSRK